MSLDLPTHIHDFFQSSQIPLTLSDPQLPDDPLILANQSFYRMTGYGPDEVLGANCRFMQGKDTSAVTREAIKKNLTAGQDAKALLRNYRKSGESFDNFLYIFTIFDEKDQPVFRIGSQFEVPEIGRTNAFASHAEQLYEALDTINKNRDDARKLLIDTGDLVTASVKQLLMARLENLRSS